LASPATNAIKPIPLKANTGAGMLGILTFLFFVNLGLVNDAFAQETATTAEPATPPAQAAEEPPPEESKVLEKIIVTGSYIRRSADEGAPSPVTTIDNTKASQSVSYSAGGVMADNAVISSGTSSNISFHGQSSANNLVLLNGLRLSKPGGAEAASIDFIPANAIERVEILKDGASALYGSEALAGVVNIITKKEFDGISTSIRHTQPEMGKGQETAMVVTHGKSFSKGNILTSLQYRTNSPVMYRDTEYGITNTKLAGSQVSNPGNLQNANSPNTYWHANDCPPENIDSRGACRYDYYNDLQFGSERQTVNLFNGTSWDLGSNFHIETTVVGTYRKSDDLNTPLIIRFEDLSNGGGVDYSISGAEANANNWSTNLTGPAINNGDKLNVLYSADEELGIRRTNSVQHAGMAQVALGQQFDRIDWDVAVGYAVSNTKDEVYSGNARRDALHDKLVSGAWNPYKPIGSKDVAAVQDARIDTWNESYGDMLNARGIISGKALDFGQKSIYAALGVEQQFQAYKFTADPLSVQDIPLTGLFSNQKGDRDVTSAFLELTENPIPALQLQVAGRFDKYSDFGSTFNPKFGAAYKVNDTLTVRSSYGTGFKAPDLRALYQGNVTRPSRLRDDLICKQNGSSDPNCNNLFSTTSYGDQTLDEERGRHFNLGLQMRPKKNWQINIDHWRAQGEQALTDIELSRLTTIETNPALGTATLASLGVEIKRDPISKVIQFIRYPLKTNSGRYDVNGIDFEVKYRNQLNSALIGPFNFTFRFDHSHTLSRGQQPFFFQAYEKSLDLEWKNVTSFEFGKGNNFYSWRVRTYSGGDKDTTRSNKNGGYWSTPTISEHDLHYEYFGAWNGVITVGVRNIFDQRIVNDLSRGGPGFLLPVSPTSLGRTFYVGYSQDF